MKKRLLALILCMIMLFVQSVSVLAEGKDAETSSDTILEESFEESSEESSGDSSETALSEESSQEMVTEESSEVEMLEKASVGIREVFINPLYEDVIDESDLKEPKTSSYAASSVSDVKYHTSIEDAGKAMREYLKTRTGTITIGIQAERYDSSLSHSISDAAMIHTGNPVEGDYLRWQYAGWRMEGSYYIQNNIYYISLTYTVTYYTTLDQERKVDQAVQELLSSLNLDGQSDYTKIKSIYDYICENVTYDYANLEDDEYKIKYTAYGALIDGTSVCQGYAILFYRLALEEDVDARLISGKGNGGAHGWNIVQLRDRYYNVDSTWDAGRSAYSYFLKCEANFGNHVRDEEYKTDDFNAQYPMGGEDYTVQDGDLPIEITLAITQDPQDYTGKVGDTASFAVQVTGKGVNYQWQYCNAGSSVWRNSGQDGNMTDTLNVPVIESRDGQKYRCIVTDCNGETVTSGEAAIHIEKAEQVLEITKQPSDYSGSVGDTAVFTVEANGSGLHYQWQYQNAGNTAWKTSGQSGNKTAALKVQVTEARDGQKYRCVITDDCGSSATSDAAVLRIVKESEKLAITGQPENYVGEVGDTAVFTVIAVGDSLTYQWEYQNVGSTVWKASGQNGNKTDTLRVPVTEARDGQKYRCVITDDCGSSATSDAAALYVGNESDTVLITGQPEDYTGSVGDIAVFIVTAEGKGLSYQWEYQNVGSTVWKASGQIGNKTDTLQVPITAARDGQKYRCVITDGNGTSLVSDAAGIIVQ
ncbi:MAG: transglutaminase domain-containing protein [Lachnospiraceae bacterium]|nr:transglutaminase domain-containing protein [Lachnospiraceae bacterium]